MSTERIKKVESGNESEKSGMNTRSKVSEARYKVLEPFVFNSNTESDPEEWINRYDLYARRLHWSEEDKINILELYIDRKERNCNQEQVFKPAEKVLVKSNGAENSDIYEALTKKFEEFSIKLISKIGIATNIQYKPRMERGNNEYHNKIFCYRCKKEGHRSWDCCGGRAQKNSNDAQKEDNHVGKNSLGFIELEEVLPEGLKFSDEEVNMADKRTMEEL
ncbi:hypothetical protein AYI70_g6040 [Smittium culicis]|uniref:CCHC-type domain-containing protein n=1 Tax=Smittium culicis TaxID=133412 RepID=A0A1R1XRQ8_9FUNG|nr:hypothetical protein AYI70_g6040 [Smittium culicis]